MEENTVNNALGDLIDNNTPDKQQKRKTVKKEAVVKKLKSQISFHHDTETLTLLNELVWMKQFVVDMNTTSQGDVVREALELLADKIDFPKLRKTHAKKLDAFKPSAGRKQKKY